MKQTINKFKVHLTTIIMLSIISFSSHAQTTRLNLLINEVNSYMAYRGSGESLNNFRKNYKGLQVGASFQAGITPSLSLVSEIYFATKGSVLKEGNPFTTSKSSLRLSTLELPLLARIHCGNLYINAGPYASYLLGGRLKTDGSSTAPETSAKLAFGKTTGGFKRWEAGLQAGAGYLFQLKRSTLALDLRYGYGLTNLSYGIERYNRTFVIGLRLYTPWKTNPLAKKS